METIGRSLDHGGSNAPRVSVLICVRNGMPYLPACIDSVFAQSLTDYEVIVVDDASSDDTRAYLETVDDPRLRRVYLPTAAGQLAASNEGLRHCRARLIARLDADDLASPDRLALQCGVMDAMPDVVACGGQAVRIDANGQELGGLTYFLHEPCLKYRLLSNPPLAHPALMIRADAVRRAGGYDWDAAPAGDYRLLCRLADLGRFANVPERVLKYRVHARSISVSRTAEQVEVARATSVAHQLRLGVASDEHEAAAFYRFSEALARGTGRPAASDIAPWQRVRQRYWSRTTPRSDAERQEIQSERRSLRWALQRLAAETARPVTDRLRLRAMGFRVDTGAVAPQRIANRVVSMVSRDVRALACGVVSRASASTSSIPR